MPHHRDRRKDQRHHGGRRPWWKSFRTTAAIGYAVRHYEGAWNRMVVERAGVVAGDRILDIGCGPGHGAALLAEAAPGVEVRAVDPAWPFVLVTGFRAFRKRLTVLARNGAAEDLPAPDGWATLVVSVNAFHHWAAPRAGLGEVRRVLAPGGRLVLVDEIFSEDHRHTQFHREEETVDPVHAGSPAVREWLAELGFVGIGVERVADAEETPHHLLRASVPGAGPDGAPGASGASGV